MEKLNFNQMRAQLNTDIAIFRSYPVLNPDREALKSRISKMLKSLPRESRELVDLRGVS